MADEPTGRENKRTVLGRSGPRWFRAKGLSCVPLGPICPGECALARQLDCSLFFVIRARERRAESNEIVDITFSQGERLDIFVKIRILQAVAFVVVADHVPKRLLRTIVKVRRGPKHVAYVWVLAASNVFLLLV